MLIGQFAFFLPRSYASCRSQKPVEGRWWDALPHKKKPMQLDSCNCNRTHWNQRQEKHRGEAVKECNRVCDFSVMICLKSVHASFPLCPVEGGGSARKAHHKCKPAWRPDVELRAYWPEDNTGSGWKKQSKEHSPTAGKKNPSSHSWKKCRFLISFFDLSSHLKCVQDSSTIISIKGANLHHHLYAWLPALQEGI